MAANYNNSAWFYDRLSRMVYGRSLINAQVYLLQYIPANANILIVGGGTGWILEELTKTYPTGLQITYVEVAADMMALSKKRNPGNNEVIFINDAIENITFRERFDVVFTPFLFDNFIEQTLKLVFGHIHKLLKPGGIWLNADFQITGKWWQRILLKSMYLFFKMLCGIEASKLPDIEKQFETHGYKEIAGKTFYGEFMVSKVYRKTYEVLKTS
jgi:ubiquinone/menaquinone biosynthesis C-methylase UbiE